MDLGAIRAFQGRRGSYGLLRFFFLANGETPRRPPSVGLLTGRALQSLRGRIPEPAWAFRHAGAACASGRKRAYFQSSNWQTRRPDVPCTTACAIMLSHSRT